VSDVADQLTIARGAGRPNSGYQNFGRNYQAAAPRQFVSSRRAQFSPQPRLKERAPLRGGAERGPFSAKNWWGYSAMKYPALAAVVLGGSGVFGGTVGAWSFNQSAPTNQASEPARAGSNCGYYTNSYGHSVPRPCGNWYDPAPPRATARCRDGTWSSSEHPYASGTCNYHGGVSSYR
jgi:hypothetical protein